MLVQAARVSQFFQALPARQDEVFADRRLLDAVSLLEFAHHCAVAARGQTVHNLVPYRSSISEARCSISIAA